MVKTISEVITCTPMRLPRHQWVDAASTAIDVFPANAPFGEVAIERIAVITSKFWGERAKNLGVAFMERPPQGLIDKVVQFANMWGEFSYAQFHYEPNPANAEVRVSFGPGGYYSYIGTDCLSIPTNQHTMNLEQFSLSTPDSEWHRVVKHEFGHALGCPHEHERQAIIDMLNPNAVIQEFRRTQGWSRQEVIDQILTPLEEVSLMGASAPDVTSIMAYQFPGRLTKNGQAIPGGTDFSPVDKQYFSKIYPKATTPVNPVNPTSPVQPGSNSDLATVVVLNTQGQELARFIRNG